MKEYFMKLSKNQKIMIIAIAATILIVFLILHGIFYSNNNELVITNESNETSDEKWEAISSNSYAKKDGKIVINVVGEVNNPGVVTLEEGARIIDQTTPNMIQRISGIFERKPLISKEI